MEKPEIPDRQAILGIIADEARIDVDRLRPDATLASLGIGSLDVVSALFAVEDRFGVEIEPEALNDVTTVDQLVARIADRISAG